MDVGGGVTGGLWAEAGVMVRVLLQGHAGEMGRAMAPAARSLAWVMAVAMGGGMSALFVVVATHLVGVLVV